MALQAVGWSEQLDLASHLLAALAAGMLIGIERGWKQREAQDGTRVAGLRTFCLIGASGGVASVIALQLSAALASVLLAALALLLLLAFLRPRTAPSSPDATTAVAAMLTMGLGVLAGAGLPALALALSALTALILSARQQAHAVLRALTPEELRALVRFAVIAVAVLPFLPDARFGPYQAWNPFQLWLVVILITGFSAAGYIARRVIGQSAGTLTTAVIGGAYSSTAVTAAFASQLKKGDAGPLATGIALASTVMYVRVLALSVLLVPAITTRLVWLIGPALLAAAVVTALVWHRQRGSQGSASSEASRPFELLPALGFLLAVAGAALLVRWAQSEFGETGGGLSLFLAGSFDVDAAMVAYATLPHGAVPEAVAALALAGTVASNMAFKIAIVFVNAGTVAGRTAGLALLANLLVLLASLALAGSGLTP